MKEMKLIESILSEMNSVSKKQNKFMIMLMNTMSAIYGKVNFSSLSRYSGLVEKTFRRWFQKPFNFSEFNSKAIDKVITPHDNVVAAFDQSFEGKSGKHTWGKDYFWNGCATKAEKGLELVLAAIVDVKKNVAYALAAEQTPAGIKQQNPKENKVNDVSRIDQYLAIIKKYDCMILRYTKYFVFDGYFTKKKFVDGIVDMGFHFIGKLRRDANLKIPYTGQQNAGPGRPKQFTGKCNIDKLEGFSFEYDVDIKTKLFAGVFHHASLVRPIKVVAIQQTRANKVGIVLLFSTDLSLSADTIFTYYKARFQIEFVFRDAKQHVGLGDCQSRKKESLHFHFNVSFMALNLVKIQEQIDAKQCDQNRSFSMASYKARNYNENLINRFFSKLAPGIILKKTSSIFKEALNYGAIHFR